MAIDFKNKIRLNSNHDYYFGNILMSDYTSITTLMSKVNDFYFNDGNIVFAVLKKELPEEVNYLKNLQRYYTSYMNDAKNFGTKIHKEIELGNNEVFNIWENSQKEKGFKIFKELKVFSKELKIIGTIDFFAINPEKKTIILLDHKVSNSNKKKYVSTQLTIAKVILLETFPGYKYKLFYNKILWKENSKTLNREITTQKVVSVEQNKKWLDRELLKTLSKI